jgi:hypothetical protein
MTIFTDDEILHASGDVVDGKQLGEILFPSLNGKGQIAYGSELDSGRGVFVDDTLVLETGSMIDGHEVTAIDRAVISATGDLAISLQLDNQDWAIAVASVPEPSNVVPIALAAMFTVPRSRRKRF